MALKTTSGCGMLVALLLAPLMAGAVTFEVNLTQDAPDANPGDGICSYHPLFDPEEVAVCTLRAAIMEGNATPLGQDVNIEIAPGSLHVLSIPEPPNQDSKGGDLNIYRPMTIGVPAGASRATIDANQLSGIFQFSPASAPSRLYGLELTGGFVTNGDNGAAINAVTKTSLVAERLDVHGNMRDELGGRCTIKGVSILLDSRIHHNGTEESWLHGICNYASDHSLVVMHSTIDNNSGIGIHTQYNHLGVYHSTVTGNSMEGISLLKSGGFVSNSTLSGNLSINYGQVHAGDTNLGLYGSIVDAGQGGSRACRFSNDQEENTIEMGWNIYSDHHCVSDLPDTHSIVSENIRLSDLGDFGGMTPTQVPLAGSDAIDRVPAEACSPFAMDQRGLPRPVLVTDAAATPCDVGAVELQTAPAPIELFADSFEAP